MIMSLTYRQLAEAMDEAHEREEAYLRAKNEVNEWEREYRACERSKRKEDKWTETKQQKMNEARRALSIAEMAFEGLIDP
jgi:hypothetical protein